MWHLLCPFHCTGSLGTQSRLSSPLQKKPSISKVCYNFAVWHFPPHFNVAPRTLFKVSMKPCVEAGIEVQDQPQMWTTPCCSLPKNESIAQDPGVNPFSSPDALQQLFSDRLERTDNSAKFQVPLLLWLWFLFLVCLETYWTYTTNKTKVFGNGLSKMLRKSAVCDSVCFLLQFNLTCWLVINLCDAPDIFSKSHWEILLPFRLNVSFHPCYLIFFNDQRTSDSMFNDQHQEQKF